MSKKILLADDSITIQKVVELTFSDGDYEVIATNNGTKAMEEIPKVKPDIILSDIIMPEKNGYELCEWVKSHPEYRHIPVILLTGTFEPFDPDRAEKAGCDAVVTKPFESQSLIQKVEELIGRAAETSPSTETEPGGEPLSGYDDLGGPEAFGGESESEEQEDQRGFEEPAPFGGFAPPQSESEPESTPFPPAEEEPKPQGDIFSDEVAPGGDVDEDDTATRMIQKMSMEDIERMREDRRDEPSSFDESPAPPYEEAPSPQPEAPASFADESSSSPFEAPGQDLMEDDATRMMPKLSMEDIRRLQEQDEPGDAAESEQAAPFEGAATEEAADHEYAPFGSEETSAQSPTEEPEPAYGSTEEAAEEFDDSATRMIPRMAFDEGVREEEERDEPAPESPEPIESPAFTSGAPGPSEDSGAANPFAAGADQDESFTAESARSSSFDSGDSSPYESEQRAPFEEEEAAPSESEEAPSFEDEEPAPDQSEQARSLEDDETFPYHAEQSTPYTEPEPELLPPPPLPPEEPVTREPEPEATAGTIRTEEDSAAASLSEEQIDRIARRVVELLSDKAVREIAWEVIPETAEMVVRERIRELEGEDA